MKLHTLIIGLFLSVSTSFASLVNFQSGSLSSYLQADGVSNLDTSYSFALGTFNESVLSGSNDTWAAGFTDQMQSTNNWLLSGPPPVQNTFQGDVSMNSSAANGQAAYIFATNAANDEILIFKNAAWVFPTYDNLDTVSDIFSLQDANTQVVNATGSFVAFDNNLRMLTVVPEPSTYAMFAGALALGYVMIRRRR